MCELRNNINESIPEAQEALEKWEQAQSLYERVMATWSLVRLIGIYLLVEKIQQDDLLLSPGVCPGCKGRLESKGKKPRSVRTFLGNIQWKRKVYRCPQKCSVGQIAPSDQHLQIHPGQKSCRSIKEFACMLAISLPYELSSTLLGLLTGVQVCPQTIWNWVQEAGKLAMLRLEAELDNINQEEAWKRPLCEDLKTQLLTIGGDGVMVPMRPEAGSPKGKTVWREVKVGLVAWLKKQTSKTGKHYLRPIQREVVAVLGDIEQFKPRLWLAALNQGILKAKRAVWLSDGGRGFWGVYSEYIASYATGILDFYHVAQNLCKGAKAWLDGRTNKAKDWFAKNRRLLRQGQSQQVLDEIQRVIALDELPEPTREIMITLYNYLDKHIEHIDYRRFEKLGFPLGSGIIESTCKWLIQQRFKGVGMRWSEEGFNHLLHLRLAWVNDTYFSLFDEEEK